MSRYEVVKVKVGFGNHVEEIEVNIPEGNIKPWEPGHEFSVVGGRADRRDAVAKVTGRAKYTYDQNLSGMLYGRIVRCPHPNAQVKSIDISEALKMPGVKAALAFDQVFSTNSIRFAWEGVAAVAAETEAQAEAAARAVKVDYEVLPFAVTLEAAMAKDAPKVARGNDENVGLLIERVRSAEERERRVTQMQKVEEEVGLILESASKRVVGKFDTPVQTHSALETHGVVCAWDGEQLTSYCSTQATGSNREQFEDRRGRVKAPSARVFAEYVGGGFGAKFGIGQEGVACALLAKAAGLPVKLMLDRREEHTSVGNRPDSIQEMTFGLDKDGKIVGAKIRNWGSSGSSLGGSGARNEQIYDLGRIDKMEYGVRTNCGPAAAMRAPGFPQGIFALESMMDMCAEAAGVDALEYRRRHDNHGVRNYEYDLGSKRFEWEKRRNKTPGSGKGTVKSGAGCASTLWFARGGRGATVLVRIKKNGSVEVRSGAQDIGTGTRTILGMCAAEELGLRIEDVATFIGDSNDPKGPGSGGSTTAPTLTPAARLAAYNAKRKLLAAVADAQNLNAAELDLAGGQVVKKGGGALPKAISFTDACGMMDDDLIDATGDSHDAYRSLTNVNAGVQFAEVEVDTETGTVRVKKVVAVSDCGKVINAKTAESQVRGAVIQGVSFALFEKRVMDRLEGRMVNADFESYKIAGAVDCPEIDTIFVDVYNAGNNTSVMGLGEPPIIATAAAIANAVHNAIGVRITSLPITPKKILEALAAKEKK